MTTTRLLIPFFLLTLLGGSFPTVNADILADSHSLIAPNRTTIYRAVGPDELADIQNTGQLINRGSAEGKYFTSSAEAASDYAKQAVNAFMDPPYTIVETQIPTKLLPKPVTVDRGIPAYVIPDEVLPQLQPYVLPTMPVPGAR